METVDIRRGQPQDIATIARFQTQMAWETEQKELDQDTIVAGVTNGMQDPSRGFYLVGEYQSKVISSLLVTYEWSDWRNGNIWYVQSVYVEAEFRGKGVFSAMYQEIVRLARAANAVRIRLYVELDNHRAQKVYEKNGMERLPYLMYESDIVADR